MIALEVIHAKRVRAGVCRHCGGKVPCWSDSGDWAVGLAYPKPKLKIRAPGGLGARRRRRK